MFDARIHRRCAFLSFVLLAFATLGCAPGLRSVRVRAADGHERTAVPRPRPPLTVADVEVQQAIASLAREVVPVADPLEFARQRFGLPIRGGALAIDLRTRQLTRLDDATAAEALLPEMAEQVRGYLQWCRNKHQPGDCLRILRNGSVLDAHGRYALAMAVAQSRMLEAMKASLKDMANPEAVMAMLVSGMTVYMMLWVLPEPVSKGIAAAMTVVLVAYLGVDTLYTLGRGWKRLVDRADAATTFDQLYAAGAEFANVMGADTARILVMVATAAMGSGAAGMAKVAPKLPGALQASRLAVAEGSVELAAVGAVETVTVGQAGLTIALAPGAALQTSLMMGSSAGGSSGTRPSRAERLAELAKDKDRGVKKDDETVRREAEVAVDMEEQGRLKGPVRRPVRDDGHSGDIVDGNGQDWDIKRPHSRAQIEEIRRQEAISKGRPPPKFDLNRRLEGEFDLKDVLDDIHKQFGSGEKVIIDTSKLNPADLAALRQALINEGILGTKVLLYP